MNPKVNLGAGRASYFFQFAGFTQLPDVVPQGAVTEFGKAHINILGAATFRKSGNVCQYFRLPVGSIYLLVGFLRFSGCRIAGLPDYAGFGIAGLPDCRIAGNGGTVGSGGRTNGGKLFAGFPSNLSPLSAAKAGKNEGTRRLNRLFNLLLQGADFPFQNRGVYLAYLTDGLP